ncbi:DUF1176 domain-containing protein [Pantoea sp. Seng]|uniref:DUF1176 domain-containing protein n=1 Tax=Pantoea sp. Seng TaxID=2576761 RepID=UPI00132B0FB2|nr:DUF1176 domain-containing protein [Pantoea sp. Seng]MXP54527.1 DUF1176 domain-containing protein [Pantoea sp. Seng]
MKTRLLLAFALLTSLSVPLLADEDGVSFSHKDWELACDNTLTCRAAGYSAEEGAGGSVLLTREGGPNAPTHGRVVLADTGDDDSRQVDALALWIDDHAQGEVTKVENDEWTLTDAQTLALINAIKGSSKVEFRGGEEPFELSSNGAFATLLKMDDAQGRLSTPGALVRKGNKPENSVPAAVAMPVIQQVKVEKAAPRPLSADELALLKPKLIASLTDDDSCDNLDPTDDQPEEGAEPLTLTPVDDTHVLIAALCWRGAYNEGYGYWLMDRAFQGKPQLITDSGSDYSQGVISEAQKGRGIGDCWSTAAWVWDGKDFVQSSDATTGMCRAIRAGGAWQLPTLVTAVKPAS